MTRLKNEHISSGGPQTGKQRWENNFADNTNQGPATAQLQLHRTTAELYQSAVTSQLRNAVRLSLLPLSLQHILILNISSFFSKCLWTAITLYNQRWLAIVAIHQIKGFTRFKLVISCFCPQPLRYYMLFDFLSSKWHLRDIRSRLKLCLMFFQIQRREAQLHRQLTEVIQEDPQNLNQAWELLEIHMEMQNHCWTTVTNQSWVNSAKQTKEHLF